MLNLYRLLFLIWFVLCCAVFIYFLKGNINDAENLIAFSLKMLVLTFPAGYIAGALFPEGISALMMGLGVELTRIQHVFIQWFFMVIAGYLQWFVFLPWLWRKWKARW